MSSLSPSPENKAALRRSLRALRDSLSEGERTKFNAAIGAHIERLLVQHSVVSLGVFWPMRNEPDLVDFYAHWARRGMNLSLPVVIGKNAPLRFAAWTPGDILIQDRFGVSVPQNRVFVPLPDVLLVPCVGFDAACYRIGYGGGFYDRTLAVTPKPLAVGVAYACQQATFDICAHDIGLDTIVTESGVYGSIHKIA